MSSYVQFIDIIEASFSKAPMVKGGVRAVYATGSSLIEETAKQLAALKAAGMGVILIDQTPSLSVFAAGHADVADIENGAGTAQAADDAVKQRQARGEPSCLYVSYDGQAALKNAIASAAGVSYWVADYSWSIARAQQMLAANSDWVAVQYGDPKSNPSTLVPGTKVNLQAAQCDIDVAKTAWADTFLPAVPVTGFVKHFASGKHTLAQAVNGLCSVEAAARATGLMGTPAQRQAMLTYLGGGNWHSLTPARLAKLGANQVMPADTVFYAPPAKKA